jgi:hypothetical protein
VKLISLSNWAAREADQLEQWDNSLSIWVMKQLSSLKQFFSSV